MMRKTAALFSAGLLQGIALVAFPAAGTIFTTEFHFSSTAYGSLFIPQTVLSICASALNPKLNRLFGSKSILSAGLLSNLLSMVLLALSASVQEDFTASYTLLMVATAFLGIGFGLVVPNVNAITSLLYPAKVDSMLLLLNVLLGLGTALSPVFIWLFSTLGVWWGLPTFLALLLLLLLICCIPLHLPGGKISLPIQSEQLFPGRLLLFAAFALLYGIVETLNGNWISINMKQSFSAPLDIQSFALAAFWGMVTLGRLFFASLGKFKEHAAFRILPFIVAAAFIVIASLEKGMEYWAILGYGVAGWGCSALLPLTISFGVKQLRSISASVPGMVICCYLLGYGIAAFGVGPLEDFGRLSLRDIYGIGAVIAFFLGILALAMMRREYGFKR